MMRKWLIGVLGLFVVLAVVGVLLRRWSAARDEAAFQDQLRMAHAEGIPITWEEFGASIKSAKPADNAAPLYRDLYKLHHDSTDFSAFKNDLIFHPRPESISAAKTLLANKKGDLELVDRAAALPRCWFDRDWSNGLTVPLPELPTLKYAAKLILLRGSLAATEKRPVEAIRDFREALHVSQQAGEEGTEIATLVKSAILTLGFHDLTLWSFAHRDEPSYHREMEQAVQMFPKLDLRAMHRDNLLTMLTVVELSGTEKGRQNLGVNPEQVPKSEGAMSLIGGQGQAKVKIAKAEREIWESYGDPPPKRAPKMEAAKRELVAALAAFPTASLVYSNLFQDDGKVDLADQVHAARVAVFRALVRALAGKAIPKQLNTEDIVSPFDGKPLEYAFDGRQITISVSCPNPDITIQPLKVPSDTELKPITKGKL